MQLLPLYPSAFSALFLELLLQLQFALHLSTGGENERPGPVGHVSISLQIWRVDLDENQLLHIPESLLRRDRVHHLHQRQRQVSHRRRLPAAGCHALTQRKTALNNERLSF